MSDHISRIRGCGGGDGGNVRLLKKCDFEANFSFGESNSDTGGFWAAFPAQSEPFGMTYFKRPTGWASNGRLVIDFLGNLQ
jgi:hypothetical protein